MRKNDFFVCVSFMDQSIRTVQWHCQPTTTPIGQIVPTKVKKALFAGGLRAFLQRSTSRAGSVIKYLDGEMVLIAAYLLKIKTTLSKIAVATMKYFGGPLHVYYLKLFTKTGMAFFLSLFITNNHLLK